MALANNYLEQIATRLADETAQQFSESIEDRPWAEFLPTGFLADLQQSLKLELTASVYARLQWSYQAARVEVKNQKLDSAPVQLSSCHVEEKSAPSSSRSPDRISGGLAEAPQTTLLPSTLQGSNKSSSLEAASKTEKASSSGGRRRSGSAGPPIAYGYKPIKRHRVHQPSKAS